MAEWYELSEDERIKQVYSKFTISDFLKWWQNGTNNIMEIRIKNFEKIKEIAQELDLPYSVSGIFINGPAQVKHIIKRCRDSEVMWFSCNSRKKNYNQWGTKSFGGKLINVNSIDYLAIDIDRINKIEKASNEELKKCDIVANKIIEKMKEQKWTEHYIKICSGNGIQLLFGLDIPIKLPNVDFDLKTKIFTYNEEFNILKDIIKLGIGKEIARFCNKFKDEYNVEIDTSCFEMARVLSLPFTKNFKYGGFTWRGIIEMKTGVNLGLTDYLLLKMKDLKEYKAKSVFIQSRGSKTEHIIKPKELEQHPLVRLMLDNQLPFGQINNIPWCSLKAILRDNKLDFKNKYVQQVHKQLEQKYKGTFTTNFPDKNYEFREENINKYCANILLPPLFPLDKIRMIKEPFNLNLDWNMIFLGQDSNIELNGNDFFEDMRMLKEVLLHSVGDMNIIVYKFTQSMIKKYGEEKSKYFFNYWFERYLGYRS